jgi:hypothetical protein
MSQPTIPNHPQTLAGGRHFRPPGSPLQDSPIPPGIHDGFQEQLAAVSQVYGQTYPATAYQGCPGATVGKFAVLAWPSFSSSSPSAFTAWSGTTRWTTR